MAAETTTVEELVADEPAKAKKGRRLKLSGEMEAMVDIEGMLEELDENARFRVLTWMCMKYGKVINSEGE